jgi:hypothetical protein
MVVDSAEDGAEATAEALVEDGAEATAEGGGVTRRNTHTRIRRSIHTHRPDKFHRSNTLILHTVIHRQRPIQGIPMAILSTDILPMQPIQPIQGIQRLPTQHTRIHIPTQHIQGTGKEVKNVAKTKKI